MTLRKPLLFGVVVCLVISAGVIAPAVGSSKITGSQAATEILVTTSGNVSCSSTKYVGEVESETVTEMSLTPSFSGCTAFGSTGEIDANGCTYLLKVTAPPSGTMSIVCPEGKEITVTQSPTTRCTLHIPSQTLGTVTYHNIAAGSTAEIEVTANLTGIKYFHTKGTGLGACAGGSATSGTYTGKMRITGEQGEAHVGVSVE